MPPGWLLLLFGLLPSVRPARVLGLFPYKGASHFYVFRTLVEELARRGHSVTVVSHVPRKEPLANYTDISVADKDDPAIGFAEFEQFEATETSAFSNLIGLKMLSIGYDRTHSLPEVLALTNESFDLVITEMFNANTFFGIAYKIGAPVIGFSSCQLLPWTADTMGAPNDLSYVPTSLGGRGPPMDFFERLMNSVELWMSRLFFQLIIAPAAQATAEKYLGPLPDLGTIAANTSLILVNSHFTLLGHRPIPPSVIEVGGINVLEPKPVPADLNKIMNDSIGVIYFSMGSVLKGSSLPTEKQEAFIKVLQATGRTILWKREDVLTPARPNIITRSWFPQRDILAHPKTELFIAHCGLLGLNEAIVSGVPVICIPMFGDQPMNAKHAAYAGIGLSLRYKTITEDSLRSAVNEVLNDKKYKKRAAEMSAAYRDRPMSPLDTAVYWTEYLLRHGPRPFMDPSRQMPIWERYGLDIAATLVGLVSIFIYAFISLIKITCCRRKVEKVKQS